MEPDAECLRSLSRLLWMFLFLAVAFEGLEFLHVAYEREEEWHVIRELIVTRLPFSYLFLQWLVGSLLPLLLLPIPAFTRLGPTTLRRTCTGLSAILVLVQVAAMRWNVVVGGQLFSKSFRGFVGYPISWWGREGLLAAAVVLTLPVLLLWGAMQVLPVWPPESDTQGGSRR